MINTFRDFLNNVLGPYMPVVSQNGDIPAGFAGVDWSFIFAGVLLVVTVYSVYKIIGGMICKIF